MADHSVHQDYSDTLRRSIDQVKRSKGLGAVAENNGTQGEQSVSAAAADTRPSALSGSGLKQPQGKYSASDEELALRRRAQLNACDPAFPMQIFDSKGEPMLGVAWGITKLEYFAGIALRALVANHEPKIAADVAIDYAQALLARLEGAEAP